MQDPQRVSNDLNEIAALLEFSGASKFKVQAYRRAAQVVAVLAEDLGGLVEQDQLRQFEGIGRVLAAQIDELWNTGTSDLLTRLRAELPAGAAELMQVEGLTPRRIVALQQALDVRSVEQLRAACAQGLARTVRGFGAKTEARLASAADRWLEREQREQREQPAPPPMVLSQALELAELIRERLRSIECRAELVGALRRGEETVRELEFAILGEPERALRELAKLRQVMRVDLAGHSATLIEGVRLQLHRAEPANLGNVLVLTTGNEAHVRSVFARGAARSSADGSTFAERTFASESALYAELGCAFVPPELRSGKGELLQAEQSGFADLLDLSDVQGLVHCHTNYSDGKNTIEEMAHAAQALGMKYITITDHSASAHYARGVTLDRLKAQWEEIAAVQEKVAIRILRGTESDILADGSLDYPDAVLEQFDVVIASIHARYRMDREAMTRRVSRALALPVFKIWGHALGRILNHRDVIDCDVPAILDVLAGSRGAIEINADPHRLDLPPAWIPEARARGIPFVVSVDAHSTRGLGVLRYGVTMARRGGVRRDEVLNTSCAKDFAWRVQPVQSSPSGTGANA